MAESRIIRLLDLSVKASKSANSLPELSVVLVVWVESSVLLNIFNQI